MSNGLRDFRLSSPGCCVTFLGKIHISVLIGVIVLRQLKKLLGWGGEAMMFFPIQGEWQLITTKSNLRIKFMSY